MILTEQTGSIQSHRKTQKPGCLGQLVGPLATWDHPTRNKRFYSKDLWVNVFNRAWVKEALNTHTLFGEADHPEGRVETKLLKAAVSLDSYEFDEDNKMIIGVFDILDTEGGRVLNTLAEYGSILGVSSRGSGSLSRKNDYSEVDPDSYVFGGFDVVALPAVEEARMNYVAPSTINNKKESYNISESLIISEINNCKSVDSLNNIMSVLESTDFINSTKVKESFTEKKSDLQSSKDNDTIRSLLSDLKEAYSQVEVLTESLAQSSDTYSQLMEESLANTISEDPNSTTKSNSISPETYQQKIDDLLDECRMIENQKQELEEKVNNYISNEALLHKELANSSKKLLSLQDILNQKTDLSEEVNSKLGDYSQTLSELKESYEDKLNIQSENQNLKLKELREHYESLLQDSQEEIEESYSQYNDLVESYNNLIDDYSVAIESYITNQAQKLGMPTTSFKNLLPENYTLVDIDETYNSQVKYKKSRNQVPQLSQIPNSNFTRKYSENNSLSEAHLLLSNLKNQKG